MTCSPMAFRILGSDIGLRVQGLGFRVPGLGFGVYGSPHHD